MSILDEIEALCGEGRLIKVEPSYPRPRGAGALEPRLLYVTPEIEEFLMSDRPLAPEASPNSRTSFMESVSRPLFMLSMNSIVGSLD